MHAKKENWYLIPEIVFPFHPNIWTVLLQIVNYKKEKNSNVVNVNVEVNAEIKCGNAALERRGVHKGKRMSKLDV